MNCLHAVTCLAFLAAPPQPQPAGGYSPRPDPPTDGRLGSNYTPAYAVNQVQMWHDFRPEVVERELAAARRHFGITMLRVFLHFINFHEDRPRFERNVEAFLEICARHGIRPGFVFFDDCHRHEGIFLDRPTTPVAGYHNGRWAACPQDRHRKPAFREALRQYVEQTVRRYRADRRVLFWEIFNEPDRRSDYSRGLLADGYRWAKALAPVQPVLCCWDDNPHTDIVDAHNYSPAAGRWDRQAALNPAKGTVFTEAGARWYPGRTRSHATPAEVLAWLSARKAAGRSTPGVMLCWELMVGNSNCRWIWATKPGTPEPTIPWCGLLWPDGTPVSLAESAAALRYVTGTSPAMFFDDFNPSGPAGRPARPTRPGWKAYGAADGAGSLSGWLELTGREKHVAGRADWGDYVVETRVMLRGEGGNAGIILRVNDPGEGFDQMRGYYVGLDTRTLYLGRMSNNWKELARFDLAKLPCRVAVGAWNLLRVEARGPRIGVWLNRTHGEAGGGLRIDYTDRADPVTRGAVGVRVHNTTAWFDDFVVLPVSEPRDVPRPVR